LRFAKEAWPFVFPFLLVAGTLALLRRPGWAALVLLLGLLVLLFFRHPARRYAGAAETVLAAADGLVTLVDRVEDPEVGPGGFHRVVTFLSVFDVHTQRAPVSGEVVVSRHTRGRKVAAFKSGIERVNERHLTVLRRPQGDLVAVRQIAGLLARRVVCYLQERQRVERGQTIGLIKFGSRVDLLVPEGYRLLVRQGERLRSGASPVAEPPAGDVR
jgi:phosphatidylserine decarboxylase